MTQPTTSEARAALLEYADRYGYTAHVNALIDRHRAAVLDEAADAIDADMERFFAEWPDEPRNSPYANGRKDVATELRRMAEEARS